MIIEAMPTAAQIADWQQQYKQVFTITADTHTAYLRPLHRKQLITAVRRHQKDVISLALYLLHTAWLGGARELKVKNAFKRRADAPEDSLFRPVIEQITNLLPAFAQAVGIAL